LLDAKDILDNASLDSYAFTRDAYLQSRETKLRDGDVQSPGNDGFEPADEEEPKANVAPTPAPADTK
jgi:phospholipid-binding lipoprotein MlaA